MRVTNRGLSGAYVHGFSYLWLLIAVALLSLSLAVVGDSYVVAQRREKERELLFIGKEFEKALARYSEIQLPQLPSEGQGTIAGFAPTGNVFSAIDIRRFPETVKDLVEDRRVEPTARHLRRIYLDPLDVKNEWGIVRIEGRIIGIHSQSTMRPLKVSGFDPEWEGFRNASSYADWVFAAPGARQFIGLH